MADEETPQPAEEQVQSSEETAAAELLVGEGAETAAVDAQETADAPIEAEDKPAAAGDEQQATGDAVTEDKPKTEEDQRATEDKPVEQQEVSDEGQREDQTADQEEAAGEQQIEDTPKEQQDTAGEEQTEDKPAEEVEAPSEQQTEDKPTEQQDAAGAEQTEDKPVEEVEAPGEQQQEDKPAEQQEAASERQTADETPATDKPVTGEAQEVSPDAQDEEEEYYAEESNDVDKGDEPTEQAKAEEAVDKGDEPTEQAKAEEAIDQAKETTTQDSKPKEEPQEQLLSAVNLEATATVKFVLMPSGQVVTMACMLGQTLQQLKNQFAAELKMPGNLILLMFDGKTMSDSTTLADLGVGPNGTVQLEMQSADPVNNPIRSYRPRQEYQMPDVITVRVQTDEDQVKDLVVEIERATKKKPFLGGFRHKVSGKEFHNASAQTMQQPRAVSGVERFCRDTQTVQQLHQVQQTFNDTSTQMTGIGVYVSNVEDKLLEPGKYTLADDHLYMMLQKVVIIQKYYRRWLAIRYVNALKEDKRRRLEWERQEQIRKQKEKEERVKREFERRMHPKTKEDFDLLYSALEKWRVEELERINTTLTGAERKAALCMLLDQETQLLAAIDRHKLETGTDNRQQRIQNFLDKAAAPKKWRGFDGKHTEMDTPFTLRAKELRDIYNSINMKYLTQDERLDVLLTLKHTVKEHDCKLTQEIIELIDREADLLMRGVKEGNLTGLRKRISTLFLQYIKTPTFNPEAAKLLKVPQDPSTLRKNIYFCPSCEKYLPSTEFNLTSNSRNPGKCRSCIKVDNDARIRQDYSHYRRMLKALRHSEDNYQDDSQIAFLMQENDLRYLVENIWSGQSVLSAWQDLYDLVLVRWDRHTQWSPWNCILLTQDEAQAHTKLVSLDEGYGEVFIHKVKQKHTLARNYFSRLPGMAELIRQHGGKDSDQSLAPGPSSIAGHAMNMQSQKV